jgi:hypothetical protein
MVLPKLCYEIRLKEMECLRDKFLCFKDDVSRLMKMVLMKIYELTNGLINLLKPTGYAMHQQCTNSRIFCSARTVFMRFVFT